MTFCRYHSKIRPIPSNEETLDMAMISTLVWGCRKTGATITGCTYSLGGRMNSIAIGMEFRPVMDDVRGELSRVTHDRAKRQVMDRIVETGGRCCLVADSRIGCSRQKAALAVMPFGDRLTAARYAPVFDFPIDRLFPGRHAGSCEKAWFRGERSRRFAGAGWRGGRIDETGNGKFRNKSCSADPYAAHFDRVADGSFWSSDEGDEAVFWKKCNSRLSVTNEVSAGKMADKRRTNSVELT